MVHTRQDRKKSTLRRQMLTWWQKDRAQKLRSSSSSSFSLRSFHSVSIDCEVANDLSRAKRAKLLASRWIQRADHPKNHQIIIHLNLLFVFIFHLIMLLSVVHCPCYLRWHSRYCHSLLLLSVTPPYLTWSNSS